MSFITDLLLKEGVKHIPKAIEIMCDKMSEDDAILIVPVKGDTPRVFVCTGKFMPRIIETNGSSYTILTAPNTVCQTYVLPEDVGGLIESMQRSNE